MGWSAQGAVETLLSSKVSLVTAAAMEGRGRALLIVHVMDSGSETKVLLTISEEIILEVFEALL